MFFGFTVVTEKYCAPLERYLFEDCLVYKHPAPTELVVWLRPWPLYGY